MKNPIETSSRHYLVSGILLLFLSSFLDNLRGPLLPILTRELAISYEDSSWLFVAGNFISVVVTFLLIPAMARYSERRTSLWAVAVAIAACISAYFVGGFLSFIGFALLLGIATGTMGAMCNIMTMLGSRPEHQRRSLSLLHMTYGLGALTSPLILVGLRDWGFSWAAAFGILLVPFVAMFSFVAVKIPERGPLSAPSDSGLMFSRDQLLPLLIFGLYVVGEVMTSAWLVTFLVEDAHQSLETGAKQMSLFFVFMALSRLANLLIRSDRVASVVMILSLVIPLGLHGLARWLTMPELLPLVGLVGSFFPLFLARLKDRFSDRWREMTVWIVVFLQIFIGAAHYLTGKLTEQWGIGVAYYLPMIALTLALVLIAVDSWVLRRKLV